MSPPPGATLEHAYRFCDPFTPLDPRIDAALHADLSENRGGDRLAMIVRGIAWSGGLPTLHFLSGHLGGGKTTELLLMKKHLEASSSDTTVLLLDADLMLNRNDVELEDILIALWALLYEQAPKAAAAVLGPLWKAQIRSALGDLAVNLPDKVPDAIGKILGDVRIPGVDQQLKIRAALRPAVSVLIDGLNQAFDVLRSTPPNDGTATFVVLIDNLEKLSQGNYEAVERLYLERMGALKALQVHLVITVPLYLCYATRGANLVGKYGGEIVVLPMIEVRQPMSRGGGDNPKGLLAMVELLRKRARFEALFEEGVGAAERIARLSGGCIRHALRMVQSSISQHDAPPVKAVSVDRGIGHIQADFERALPEQYVPVLKQIAKTNRFPDDCDKDIKRDLLLNLFALEYQNGSPDPWYAVHPLVERCRKYRERT